MLSIEYFVFHRMWDKYDICWRNIRPDVNILVGINGKGKTTLLDAIDSHYNRKFPQIFYKTYGEDRIEASHLDCPVVYIQSSDVPAYVKKKGHCVFDLITRIGNALCNGTHSFEYEVLRNTVSYNTYSEIQEVIDDIRKVIA